MAANLFDTLRDIAPRHTKAFCQRYLPQGKLVGEWWLVRCPWREDKNPSLGVSIVSGKWKDFAKGDHGDLSDLLSRLDGCSTIDAAKRLAAMMGVRS